MKHQRRRERTVHVTRDTLCSIALLPFRLFVFCSVLGVVCPSTTEYISRAEPFHSEWRPGVPRKKYQIVVHTPVCVSSSRMKSFAVFLLVIGMASSQHIGLGSPAMKGSHPSSLKSNLPSATELSSSRARVPLRNYVPLVGEEVYGKQHNDATGGGACCTKDCECNGVASCCAKVQMVKAVQVQRGTLPNIIK